MSTSEALLEADGTTALVLAQAAPDPAARQPGFLDALPMVLLIFGIFYFLLIRPQNKAREAHQKLLDGLKKGDEVVTDGGILGRVFEVQADRVVLEVSKGGKLTLLKDSVKSRPGDGGEG